MGSIRDNRREAKAEEKAEKAALKAKLEGIAGQIMCNDRCILFVLLDQRKLVVESDNDRASPILADLGLIEIETVEYCNERYSLTPLGKQVVEFIKGLPYHQFINVGEDFVGPKFDENRPLKETAKLIKKEILECERQEFIPKGKWSVTTKANTIHLKFTSKHIQPDEYDLDPNVDSIVYCLTHQYNKYQGLGSFDVFPIHNKEE